MKYLSNEWTENEKNYIINSYTNKGSILKTYNDTIQVVKSFKYVNLVVTKTENNTFVIRHYQKLPKKYLKLF